MTNLVIVEDRLYSIKDSAQVLGGLSPWTINSWLSKGRLRRVKVGRRTMIRGSELLGILVPDGKSPARPRPAKECLISGPNCAGGAQ
jgi:hypothetical protein